MAKATYTISAKDKTNKAVTKAKKNLKGLESSALGVKAAFGALAASMALRSVVNTVVEFEKLEASLVTVTGSTEAATKAFKGIKEFAKKTPFQVTQITEAFIKMKALGLDPSEAALKSYGNTASAMGKDLNQMIEAVADAATGEFERLKEFGIKARSQGDKVSFTFNNVTTTIGKNAKEIEGYLKNIGDVKFAGAMEKQMDTLGGSFSNLSDAMAQTAEKIGKAGLSDAIKSITSALVAMTEPLSSSIEGWGFLLSGFKEFEGQAKIEKINELTDTLDGLRNKMGGLTKELRGATSGGISGWMNQLVFGERDEIIANINEVNEKLISLTQERQALMDEMNGTGEEGVGGVPGKTPDELAEEARIAEQLKLDLLYATRVENDSKNLERVTMFLASQTELENTANENHQFMIEDAFQSLLISDNKRKKLLEKLERKHQDKLTNIDKKALTERQKFEQMTGLMQVRTMLGMAMQITQGTANQNKTLFRINKYAALANAAVSLPTAVLESFKNGGGYPYGLIPAGLMLATGLQQISTIKSATFGGGGGAPSIPSGGGVGAPINTLPIQQPGLPTPSDPIADTASSEPKQIFNIEITGNPTGDQIIELLEEIEDKTDDNTQFNIMQGVGV